MKYVIEFRPIPADATCTNCAGLQAKANSSARKNGTETERSLTLSSNEKNDWQAPTSCGACYVLWSAWHGRVWRGVFVVIVVGIFSIRAFIRG